MLNVYFSKNGCKITTIHTIHKISPPLLSFIHFFNRNTGRLTLRREDAKVFKKQLNNLIFLRASAWLASR